MNLRLIVNILVFDEQGNPTRILAVTEVMEKRDCYELIFSDGARIVADAEHLWTVYQNGLPVNLRTVELQEDRELNVTLPFIAPVKYDEKELPMPPYEVGASLMRNKIIPPEYLQASIAQREEVLRGLIDVDGWRRGDDHIELLLESEELFEGVKELIFSLGFIPKFYKRRVQWKYNGWPQIKNYFHLSFDMRLKTKRHIKEVLKTSTRPVKCIMVNSRSSLYLVGKTFIPTHNSEGLLNVIGRFVQLDPCNIMIEKV